MILILLAVFPLFAADFILDDLSNSRDHLNTSHVGSTISPAIDSIRYRSLLSADTVITGRHSTAANGRQAAWPMITSREEGKFRFSYIWFNEAQATPPNPGNHIYEKTIELSSVTGTLTVSTPLDPVQSHRDSMGLLLTKRILPLTGLKIGGMNGKGFSLPNGRHIRVCQGWGGNRDSIYIIDTTDNTNSVAPFSLMDSSIAVQTYPDYAMNVDGDTLFVVFSPNNARIVVTPFRITHPNSAAKLQHVNVVSDPVSRRDYGIARDPVSGIFLVTAYRSNSVEVFRLSANLSMTHTSQIQTGLPTHNTNARIISVVSIGNNRFAVVYFFSGSNGAQMKIVDASADITTISTIDIDAGSTLVPNLYYNSGRLAVVWVKDLSALPNNGRIFGKIYSIENGAITDTLFSGSLSSSSTVTENYFNVPANYRLGISIDSYGNLISSYVNQTDYRLYLTAHVPTFFYGDSGSFILRDSIDGGAYGSLSSDSIRFSGFSANNIGAGSVDLMFRTSTDNTFTDPFNDVNAGTIIPVLGRDKFEFRFRMVTGADAAEGPRIASASLRFNVKPIGAIVDSVRVGQRNTFPVSANDTISIHRGTDSLRLYFSASDFDNASQIQYHFSGYSSASGMVQRIDNYHYSGTELILPSIHSDTTYRLSYSVADTNGWGSDSFHIFVRIWNPPPVDSIRSLIFGRNGLFAFDTITQNGDTIFAIDSGYNVIRTIGKDSNNTVLNHYFHVNGVLKSSKTGALVFNDTVYADSIQGMDTVMTVIEDGYGLSDTTRFYLRVSHTPSLVSVAFRSRSLQHNITTDSANVRISTSEPDTFIITARDPDIILDDRLTFRMVIDGVVDTSCIVADTVVAFFRAASATDRRVVLSVSDQSGVSDSIVVNLKYPLASLPNFQQDSLFVADSMILFTERRNVSNGVNVMSYRIPLASSGTDTLYVNSIRFCRSGLGGIFKTGTAFSRTGLAIVDSSVSIRKVAPRDTLYVVVKDSAAIPFGDSGNVRLSLIGADTIFYDTLLIATNDQVYDTIKLYLRLVVNEPPFVVNDAPVYRGNNMPLMFVFSEAMQRSDTSLYSLEVYSYHDSLIAASTAGKDTTPLIPVRLLFGKGDMSRFDTLFVNPVCSSFSYVSSHFGIMPKDGSFIATDRIRIKLPSAIRDVSDNRLDLNNDRVPDSLNVMRVYSRSMDSSGLVIVSVSPDSGTVSDASLPLISVTFSTPINPDFIDTALANNRTIRIRTATYPDVDYPLTAPPLVSGNILTFRPSGGFAGNDTINVTISSSIRDSFSNTLDGNRNGMGNFLYLYGNASYAIADTFMTSLSHTGGDNYTWLFYTGSQNFYVFPVPFEPVKNSRHAAQGGIVFKNLQMLTKNDPSITAIDVLLFAPDGTPVYSTAKKGETISVGAGLKPFWKWTAVNNGGRNVASGVYVYCITAKNGQKILKRGKVIVIR